MSFFTPVFLILFSHISIPNPLFPFPFSHISIPNCLSYSQISIPSAHIISIPKSLPILTYSIPKFLPFPIFLFLTLSSIPRFFSSIGVVFRNCRITGPRPIETGMSAANVPRPHFWLFCKPCEYNAGHTSVACSRC